MKAQYRIRNWSQYNAALKQRGSLTFWVDEAVLDEWIVPNLSGKPGASPFYSDLAILTMATLKAVYRLAGRQCQGFITSLFELMQLELPVPDHSILSRRLAHLSVSLPVLPQSGARHVVVDSTGVKVYGEGEWKTRQHGISKRRTIALRAFKKGASCIWGWMKPPEKSWQRWSPATTVMMGKC